MRRPPEKENGPADAPTSADPKRLPPLAEVEDTPDSSPSAVAGRIRFQRRSRRWNPEFVGKLAALPVARVRQLELGEGKAGTRAEIARLARALSVGEAYILTGTAAAEVSG